VAGLITLQTIFDQTRAILGNRNATDLPNATLLPWTNWTLDQLASPRVYRHPELWDLTSQTLATADRLYTIDTAGSPVDTVAILSVVIVSSTDPAQRLRLRPVTLRDGFTDAGRITSGTPVQYSLYSPTEIELYPTPSSTYSTWNLLIRRIKVPTSFTVAGIATEKSPLHRFFDEALVLGTVWRGWRHQKEVLRAEAAKAEFGQVVNEVTDRLSLEAEDRDFGPEVYVEDGMP
jgi:hypothetical protein